MTGSDKGLNRTFYGIETKFLRVNKYVPDKCLNRTFYGIETILTGGNVDLLAHVLIVPFMELKRVNSTPALVLSKS